MMPDIPARLLGRPLSGGLVVPYISVASGDGRHVLGHVHTSRRNACVVDQRCQIDGQRLEQPCVALVTPSELEAGWSREPAMHPECARYSAAACPMASGQMSHYRSTAFDVSVLSCDKPGCDCGGWVPSADSASAAGKPAEPYSLMWLSQYDTAVNAEGAVIGISWQPSYIRRLRPLAP